MTATRSQSTKVRLQISGPAGRRSLALDGRGTTIGRSESCDVALDSENVSRVHARIWRDPFGRWIVEDLDSHNGVYVEAERVRARAVVPGQRITICEYTLVLSGGEASGGAAEAPVSIPVVDLGPAQDIVSYSADGSAALSAALVHRLNELTNRLLGLSEAAMLYGQACDCLAETFDCLASVVRLPGEGAAWSGSPEVLACSFGREGRAGSLSKRSYVHFSKRLLEAVRTSEVPVMACSRPSPGGGMTLTVVDEHDPHVVFGARVNHLGEYVDALYVDLPQNRSPEGLFDFIEAAARQIDFAQKALFLAELARQKDELAAANMQLKQKDRIKDEYVSRLTHDIKGHVAVIYNYLYTLCSGPDGLPPAKRSEFLGSAMRRSAQLGEFIRELLDLTKMRLSGRMETEPMQVAQVAAGALEAVADRAAAKSITVTSAVDPSAGEIVGNTLSVTEMLTNLLFNAVKYTPEGRTVHLDVKGFDEQVEMVVKDTGIGIPADDLASVFDEFFRAKNARSTERDGTGLGLSIVKQIVDRHGGTVSVESTEGSGTVFSVVLPRNNFPEPGK
jgi:signal transduction histidine kinase